GGDQRRALPEGVLRGPGQEGRVHAAGERHDHAGHPADKIHQPVVLGVELVLIGHRRFYPRIAPASWARGTIGRAPTWAMTSAAASDPSRPQVGRSKPWLSP